MRQMVREFSFFFAIQFIAYAAIALNTRAIAQAWIGTLVISDIAVAFLTFKVIKKVAEAESHAALAGYVIGGACGSVVSVLGSKWVFGR